MQANGKRVKLTLLRLFMQYFVIISRKCPISILIGSLTNDTAWLMFNCLNRLESTLTAAILPRVYGHDEDSLAFKHF